MNFWFLVRFEEGLNEWRLALLKDKLHNDLCQLDNVFLVVQAELKKLAKYDYFSEDFSLYYTQLLLERKKQEQPCVNNTF
jgi:hypothetical protein